MIMYGSIGDNAGLSEGDFLKLTPSISSEPPLELDSARKRWRSRLVNELLLAMFSFSACMPRIFGGVENVGGGVGGILNRSSVRAETDETRQHTLQ
jgi:hypothetical protein